MVPGRPLTVLQMLPALDAGGVERGTLEVGRHLVANGHRSLVMSAGGRLVPELERDGSTHLAWDVGRKSLWTLRLVPGLRRLLTEQAVDIIHLRSRMPAWIGYLAWRGMPAGHRPHLVTTVHGPYSVNAYSAVMTRGERIIAVSDTIRDYILANYPRTDPDRIRVIHRGVDPAVFPCGHRPSEDWLAAWLRDHPETAGKRLLTLPGRITRWKGQEDFLHLLAELKRRGLSVHGLLIGEAHPRRREFMDELRGLARDLGIGQDVSFCGHRGDLREIMAISAIVFSLSREPEAFGRVSLEALALGVPVIAYDHGGVGEQMAVLLPEGGVPVGDWRAAAERAAAWLGRPPDIGADNPFTLARMLDATLAIYAELTG